jgi:hypothetical protein
MKNLITLSAVVLLVAGVFCGGGEEPAEPVSRTESETPAAAPANLPDGYPAEAFAKLTKAEMEAYVKCLPGVGEAFKSAGYKAHESDPPDLVADLATTINGMEAVPGVVDAITAAGLSWDSYRKTTFKAMCASSAMAMGIAEALMSELEGEEGDAARAELAKAKVVFDQVPEGNQTMLFEYMEQLSVLDELEEY